MDITVKREENLRVSRRNATDRSSLLGRTFSSVQDLRERLLGRVIAVVLVGGAIAYLPSAYLSIQSGLWVVFIADTVGVAYASVLAIFSSRFSYGVKVFSSVAVFYAIGVVLLVYTGHFGAGNMFLFAAVFLSALFGARRSIIIANSVATLTLIAFSLGCAVHLLPWRQDAEALIVMTFNFTFIALILSFAANYLLRGYAESALKERQLREAEQALIMELEHRVRNNLQVVTSLVNLRSDDGTDPRGALDNIRSAIGSISYVHRLLYKKSGDYLVALDEVLRAMVRQFVCEYPEIDFAYEWNGAHVSVSGDFAVALTIMINEMLRNAVKHAFEGKQDGQIAVWTQHRELEHIVQIRIKDNGLGMQDNVEGTGLQIIRALADQLGAKLEVSRTPGVTYLFEASIRRLRPQLKV